METQVGDSRDRWSIGELARRSGLSVKTIRYYSDVGVLPPAGRTAAGYRRYGPDDLVRLDLVRTLRELGIDLPAIRRVLEQQSSLTDVLALHGEALETQARSVRLRQAVLAAAARHGGSPEYLVRAQRVIALGEVQRRATVDGFLDQVASGVPIDAGWWAAFRAAAVPELPQEPTAEQIDAWVELAELAADPDFVRGVRSGAEWFWTEAAGRFEPAEYEAVWAAVVRAGAGVTADAVTDDAAEAAVDAFAALHARMLGRVDGPAFRSWLATELERWHEPRAQRYWELVAVVTDRPAPEPVSAAYRWLLDRLGGGSGTG